MTSKREQLPPGFRNMALLAVHNLLWEKMPHLYAVMATNKEDFVSLTLKAREDGVLAVVNRVSFDGAREVCFGTGYDAISALVAVDKTIQAGSWRPDKPWKAQGGKEE